MVGGATAEISAEKQVQFLRNVQRLLSEGSFVATYKYALLHALADLSLSKFPDVDGRLTLQTSEIAERFIELYWRQTADYPLRDGRNLFLQQNTGRQAAVVREIRGKYDTATGSFVALRRDPKAWKALVRSVQRTVEVMPLWKLQRVGEKQLDFLYPNRESGHEITLRPGVAFCFRAFHGLVVELVRGAWLRYIRRFNLPTRESHELSTFLFGSDRSNLAAYRRALEDVDESFRCFYCNKKMTEAAVEVDHFVPWSRYPNDLGHNFVLAHDGCNRRKSDHLACEDHLAKWLDRNSSDGKKLGALFDTLGLYHDRAATERVGYWAYEQLAASGGQVWVRSEQLEPLGTGWLDRFDLNVRLE